MADKPAETLEWASQTVIESETINGSPESLNNKLEPTEEFKDSGLLFKENFPRPYLNFFFDLVSRWINNLDERTSIVGAIYLTKEPGITVGILATRFGGTWTARGTDTIGTAASVNVFERTA